VIFKWIPDVKIRWMDVWVGAFVTAVLFTLGKWLIGLYLGRGSIASVYGAVGSLAILLIWVYYSAQILYIGAEFTQVFARRHGERIRPADYAVPLGEQDRIHQGIPHKEEVDQAERERPPDA
jgi:membrane protein